MFLPEGGFAAKKFLELTNKGAGTKAGKYIGLRAVNNFFTKASKSKIGNTIIDLERQAQWHGGVEEFLEEIADGSMNAWLVGDQVIRGKDGKVFGTTDKNALFNQDNLIDTALGVGVMSLAFPFAKTLGYGYEKSVAPKIESFRFERKVKRMMRNADDAGLNAFGGDETAWGQVRNKLSMGSEDDVKRALLEVFGSDDYSDAQKIAARDYAVASQGHRLIESMLDELRSDLRIYALMQAYEDGYDADEQQRSDIAIEAADGKEGAEEAWNGVQQRINDDADMMAAEQREEAKVRTNKNDGAIHPATLKELDADGNPKEVFVVDGDFSMDAEGNISGSDVIVVYDPVEGKNREISPMEISSLGDVTTAEQQEENIEANKQAYIQQQMDAASGVVHVEPGYQFTTQDGEQAVVVAVNGDDIVYLLPDGRQEVTSLEAVQQIVDAARMEAYRMSHPEAQQVEAPEQPVAEQPKGAPEAFEPMMELTIRDKEGNEQTVVVTGGRARFTGKGYEDDPNGKFVELYVPGSEEPMYIHENELQKRTVDYKEAEQPKEEVTDGTSEETQPVGDNTPADENKPSILKKWSEDGSTSISPVDALQQPADTENISALDQLSDGKGTNNISSVQAMPMRTVTVGKGKDKQDVEEPDFMATTAQRGHQYIYNEKGYPREVADEMVQTRHGNAAKTLDELTKSEPKMSDSNIGGSMALYDKIHGEWQAKKQAAEQEVKYWEDVMAEQQKAIAAEQAALKAQRQAQKEAEQGVPDMSVDKAADARRRGYRVSMGNRFDRQEPVQGMTGYETEIKFSDNDKVKGIFKVVESQQVQPSHMRGQRNPLHFITEAQPKDRTDEVSDDKSSKMAKNINPKEITEGVTAYVGAPIINSRGEVIQGNNRAISLKKLSGYPESAAKYKQYLIDHAAEFGLNADEIAKMENPVLVREVDVTDDEAIRLGQFTANDTESGGKQRMSASNILGQLDEQKTKSLFNLLLETGESEEDMTLDQIIDRNGTKVMTWLNRNGVINATQTQSAYDSKGHMTPEAKNDLKELITHHIFKGGSDAIGEAWGKLPVAAQKALAVAMAGDLQLKPEDRLLPDVQNAIMVAGRIENTMPEEVKSARRASEAKKRLEEMEKVVKAATQQMDLTTNKPIISGYSDLEMKIAAEILSLNQSQIKAIFEEYQRYVLGTGGSLFGEATKMSRQEAVEKTFNVKDTRNGSERETGIAESGDGARAEQLGRGERPSQGAAASGEPGTAAAAEQPAGEVAEQQKVDYRQQAEKAIADILDGVERGGSGPVVSNEMTEAIQRIADMEADAEEALDSGVEDADRRAQLEAQRDAASKWLDENVRGQRVGNEEPVKTTKRDKAILGALVDKLRKFLGKGRVITKLTDDEISLINWANGNVRLNAAQKRTLETARLNSQGEGSKGTVVSSVDGAKILKNLDTLADKLENKSNQSKTFIGDVARAIGAKQFGGKSQYATFETKNGLTVTIRLGNHNATVSNFDNNGENNGISIVISRNANKGITNDGAAHLVEFFYPDKAISKAEGKPLAEIVRSIKQSLYSGEYKDNTGIAEREEVNARQIRFHRVFHGSGADFERFDSSHMGEGEGAQVYGYGHYTTEVEGIGRTYASIAIRSLSGGKYKGKLISEIHGRERTGEDYAAFFIYDGMTGGRTFEEAVKKVKEDLESDIEKYPHLKELNEEILRSLLNIKESDFDLKRTLYTVEIPDDNGSNYLEWDEPIKQKQLSQIASLLAKEKGKEYGDYIRSKKGSYGENIYYELYTTFGSQEVASKFLSRAGFTGIKYPAEYRSGGREDNAKNYVIFDENDLRITDKVKFFRTPDGEAFGFTVGGKIYIDMDIAKADTAVHEYTHLWVPMVKEADPKMWQEIKDVLTKDKDVQPFMEIVKQHYPELTKEGREDDFMEEVLAHFSGAKGLERLEEAAREYEEQDGQGIVSKAKAMVVLNKVKSALEKFWGKVAELFGIKFRNAQEIADKVLSDLLHGVDPTAVRSKATEAKDKAYMEAVEKGDMEIAQRMVNEAAKVAMPDTKVVDENGEPLMVVHHTNNDFTEFDIDKLSTNSGDRGLYGNGFYFSTKGYGGIYGNREIEVYLDIKHPFEVKGFLGDDTDIYTDFVNKFDKPEFRDIILTDYGKNITIREYIDAIKAVDAEIAQGLHNDNMAQNKELQAYKPEDRLGLYREGLIVKRCGFPLITHTSYLIGEQIGSDEFTAALKKAGYDGVIVDKGEKIKEYVAFKPNQIKSADPVTYDDQGNVIPLSQRFNSRNADIRWQRGHTVDGLNSGYTTRDNGTAISNRAAYAESEGKYTEGKFRSQYKVGTKDFALLKALGLVKSNEWHHTGRSYTKSDFYEWEDHGTNDYNEENLTPEGSLAEKYQEKKKEIAALAKAYDNAKWEHEPLKRTGNVPSYEQYSRYFLHTHKYDLLSEQEEKAWGNEHEAISAQWETVPSYERKMLHEAVDNRYMQLAASRINEEAVRAKYNEEYGERIKENERIEDENKEIKKRNAESRGKEYILTQICEAMGISKEVAESKAQRASERIRAEEMVRQSEAARAEAEKKADAIRVESEKKQQAYVERMIKEGRANRLVRVSKRPENFVTKGEEMYGRYGWFDASSRYNLPVYYSGIAFDDKRAYNHYNKIADDAREKINEVYREMDNAITAKNNSQYAGNENGEQLQVGESPEEEYSYRDMARKLERGEISQDEAYRLFEQNREDIAAIEDGEMQDAVPDLYAQLKGQQAALRQWVGDKVDAGAERQQGAAIMLQQAQQAQETYVTNDGVQLNMDSLLYGTEQSDAGAVAEPVPDEQQTRGKDLTDLRLRKLKPGETCHVERRYEESRQFSFTGKDKIESMDDVAYIFKQLETAAVENTFLAMVKDGRPIIIHIGMGEYTSAPADARQALAAYIDIKPDKVYFIHNHPSGALNASRNDRNALQRMSEIFGARVVQDGIIIDTVSGKYGVFGVGNVQEKAMPSESGDDVPMKVYTFSKQVFSPDWNPQEAFKITNSGKVAEFVSSHRLGEHKKMSLIVVNNSGAVVGNFFLPWTKLSDIKELFSKSKVTIIESNSQPPL